MKSYARSSLRYTFQPDNADYVMSRYNILDGKTIGYPAKRKRNGSKLKSVGWLWLIMKQE